jgi:hypothetical protein
MRSRGVNASEHSASVGAEFLGGSRQDFGECASEHRRIRVGKFLGPQHLTHTLLPSGE